MVAGGAFQYPAGVVNFAKDEVPRIAAAQRFAVGDAVLGLPQQDIAALFADGARQKLAVGAEKAEVDALGRAFAHERRACTGAAEADDPFQRVERDPPDLGLLAADHDIFTVERKIGVFRSDVKLGQ